GANDRGENVVRYMVGMVRVAVNLARQKATQCLEQVLVGARIQVARCHSTGGVRRKNRADTALSLSILLDIDCDLIGEVYYLVFTLGGDDAVLHRPLHFTT